MPDREFLSLGELAEMVNASPLTIRNWISKGLLTPSGRFGRNDEYMFKRGEVEEWLKGCRRLLRPAKRE